MAEELIAAAFLTTFKSAKIPPELYEKRTHELRVDEHEVVKVNMTLKRGLVVDIEEDSHFRTFLNTNDIVLTVNDKVAGKADFKLHDLFKEKGGKSYVFTYIRMKNITDERIPLDDSERKDGYDYRVLALFHYQRISMGLIVQPFQGSKVMVVDVAPKTIGAACLVPGDCVLQINGVRQGSDAAGTLETMAKEMELKGFVRVTVERPCSEVTKAIAAFTIQTDHRDLPVPADCAAYVREAVKALRGPEPKSIMKSRPAVAVETAWGVAFHERISTESVIPSDIEDELLIKTPSRVPAVTAQLQQQQQEAPPPPPPLPSQSRSSQPPPSAPGLMEKAPSSVMGGVMGKPPPSVMGPPPPPLPPAPRHKESTKEVTKESKKSTKAAKRVTVQSDSSKGGNKGRHKPSAEVRSGHKKPTASPGGGTQEKASKTKAKKKNNKKPGNHTGGDTEGTGH